MYRAAVIGCGDVSAVHFAALKASDDVELVAVCDTEPARLAEAAHHHAVAGYSDFWTLYESERPDVVHICTPHNQHVPAAVAALERGINVICEKPLASRLDQGQMLLDAAESSTAKIGICFQNRYNTAVSALQERVSSGEFGAIKAASGTVMWSRDADYYQARPWRGTWQGSGGGLLMNQAIHTLDLLQWMMGQVVEVSASASTRVLNAAIEVEDTAELVLSHANGIRSLFYASNNNGINEPITLSIECEKASLYLRGDLTITHQAGLVEVVAESRNDGGGRDYWGSSHARLITDFYAQLESAQPFWIDPAEAMKTLRIIKEVYAQSQLGSPEQIA